ncbi:unnamed protein product [Linum tenue]|uniref:WRKY transcription factor 11 n=1 Tax=Linum tenue TaxID=586396 RepID=A0AAV0LYT0_9ROSI|nr:unnamed protein product [Linum tenue]
MAVDLMSFRKIDDQMAIQEAANQGLQSMESLIRAMSRHHHQHSSSNIHSTAGDCTDLTEATVSRFKKVISLLNRTGHARFRRAPLLHPRPHSPPSAAAEPPPAQSCGKHRVVAAPVVPAVVQLTPPPTPIQPVAASIPAPSSFAQSQSLTLDFTKP